MTDPLTHPGQLCTSGDRAADLALELGQARVRLARYEAQEARIRALHRPLSGGWGGGTADLPRLLCTLDGCPWPCSTIAGLDEPMTPPTRADGCPCGNTSEHGPHED